MDSRRSVMFALGAAMLATVSLGAQATTRIAPKDKLTIKVVSGVDLGASEFAVDGEGTIDFPYLGKVKVAGLTPRELAAQLAPLLVTAKVLSGQPQLTVDLEQVQGRRVSVSGAVATPGEFSYAGEMSVYSALLRAGGATSVAGDEVQVIRVPREGEPSADAVVETLSRSFDSSEWNVPEVPSAQELLMVLGWLGSGPLPSRPSSREAPESQTLPTPAHFGAFKEAS